jgi:hypothetical protein
MHTADISHDTLSIQNLACQHVSCTNVNAKKKDYIQCHCLPEDDLTYQYSQLYYKKSPIFKVTTPVMTCPFGVNNSGSNFKLCLQFTNYKSDPEMKSFLEFIRECEYKQMELLGLTEENSDLFVSQIKYDKKNKYDPNLEVKIPFNYNRFECDIYSDSYSGINIMNISKFCKVQCDIYLDKIWKYNDNYISKWKVKMIHLV